MRDWNRKVTDMTLWDGKSIDRAKTYEFLERNTESLNWGVLDYILCSSWIHKSKAKLWSDVKVKVTWSNNLSSSKRSIRPKVISPLLPRLCSIFYIHWTSLPTEETLSKTELVWTWTLSYHMHIDHFLNAELLNSELPSRSLQSCHSDSECLVCSSFVCFHVCKYVPCTWVWNFTFYMSWATNPASGLLYLQPNSTGPVLWINGTLTPSWQINNFIFIFFHPHLLRVIFFFRSCSHMRACFL